MLALSTNTRYSHSHRTWPAGLLTPGKEWKDQNYAQKLTNSEYSVEQVRRIIINGIKGYKNNVRRTKDVDKQLHSEDSFGAMNVKKNGREV